MPSLEQPPESESKGEEEIPAEGNQEPMGEEIQYEVLDEKAMQTTDNSKGDGEGS